MSYFLTVRWLSDEAVARLKHLADRPEAEGTRYTLREEIGRGGMGTVYRADDAVLGRPVALKVLSVERSGSVDAERLLREARGIARLEHPGLVPVHDAGVLPDGRAFYAMKLVDGSRLDRYAGSGATLADRLAVFRKICDALAFAHAHGAVHRDVKPSNVMIGAFGEVLVLDWGVARFAGDPGEAAAAVVGTRDYMAPEQRDGRSGTVDARADVYALGAILRDLVAASPAPEPSAARPRAAIAARAMARDPNDRYPGAAALSADVGRFLAGEPVAAYRERPLERAARLFRRHRVAAYLVLAYLAARVLLLALLGR